MGARACDGGSCGDGGVDGVRGAGVGRGNAQARLNTRVCGCGGGGWVRVATQARVVLQGKLLVVGIPFEPTGSTTYLEKLSELKAMTGADLAKLVRLPGAFCVVLAEGGVIITPSGYITMLCAASVVVIVRWGSTPTSWSNASGSWAWPLQSWMRTPALKTSPYAAWCDMQANVTA